MRLLLDTDVASFSLKGDSRYELYRPIVEAAHVCLSFMTVAELYLWAFQRNWGPEKVRRLDNYVENTRVIETDSDICRSWATVVADSLRRGRPIAVADAWIAATAVSQGLPLATHNQRHFQHVSGLNLISFDA